MKRSIMVTLIASLMFGMVVTANGSDTGTIGAYAQILGGVEVGVDPDSGADGKGIGVNDGVLNFGVIPEGTARATYEDIEGVGGTQTTITVSRALKDTTDPTGGYQAVTVDFELKDVGGSYGEVVLKHGADASKTMTATLVVTAKEDGTEVIDNVDYTMSGSRIIVVKADSGKYLVTVPDGDYGLPFEPNPASVSFFVHGELEAGDTQGALEGSYVGEVEALVRYTPKGNGINPWL